MPIKWKAANLTGNTAISSNLRICLLDTGSLIRHLERFSPENISLHVEAQSWKKPRRDESNALKLRSGSYVFLRETFLMCNTSPWVYARTIIPPDTLSGSRRLAHWGSKPIGYYLFSDKSTYRGAIGVSEIKLSDIPYHPIYNLAIDENDTLWARRSIFYIKNKPLLLIEIFLPDSITCINALKK